MKKYFLIALLVAVIGIAGCAKEAEATNWDCDGFMGQILNACVEHPDNPEVEPNREVFDTGLYLHNILWESDDGNFVIGNWNTWEIKRNELTALVGATIYWNRLTYQK